MLLWVRYLLSVIFDLFQIHVPGLDIPFLDLFIIFILIGLFLRVLAGVLNLGGKDFGDVTRASGKIGRKSDGK